MRASKSPRRRAIVTGATGGIGRCIAETLAAGGADVLLVGRDQASLAAVGEAIQARGGRATWCAVDLVTEGAAEAVVQAALDKMQGVDILVNCASATLAGDFFDVTDAQWSLGFEVKVFGAIRLCRAAWPHLRKSNGSIVNIGGIGARTPRPGYVMSGALSAALMAITKALADRGISDGVQVNLINPGSIRTPRIEATFGGSKDPAVRDAALQKRARGFGATRLGEPQDIADMVGFVVSPSGDFLQGSMIDMDGGATKGI